jgi:enoyl-CoA hydratase/carnithine racemase
MSATEGSLVRTERSGRLLVVRMCRESKRNAVNRQLADELDAAFNLLEDDADLWAGVLTGTTSVFSARWRLRSPLVSASAPTRRSRCRPAWSR